ncbi:MAG: slipin family protein [Candidatus Omnitrophica bacterium]|nr:slipin family protein [Candidatus Omnitrophota bacterium]
MMGFIIVIGIGLFLLWNWVKILSEYERAVIYQLGRIADKPRGPGVVFVMWPFERAVIISSRIITLDIPPQDIITKDNVSAKVNAVCYFRVVNPIKADVEIQNYQYATLQKAQTTLRSVLGQMEFDDLLANRELINEKLQTILDKSTESWGIKVVDVEIKDVDVSEDLRKAMARQAEAERERRAKVIASIGEFEAAEKVCEAAKMMQEYPMALQLRYLQTLVEIGGGNNTTTVFPIPIDFLKVFAEKIKTN